MDYIDRDYADVQAYCEELLEPEICASEAQVQVVVLPPQKTPKWAKQYTAVARGSYVGNGNYVRFGVGGAE